MIQKRLFLNSNVLNSIILSFLTAVTMPPGMQGSIFGGCPKLGWLCQECIWHKNGGDGRDGGTS